MCRDVLNKSKRKKNVWFGVDFNMKYIIKINVDFGNIFLLNYYFRLDI
jgi:hypothetical protein